MDFKIIANKISSLIPPLVCPVCHAPFEFQSQGLRCRSGHSYNYSKSGSINFISQKINQKTDSFYRSEQALHGLDPYCQLMEAIIQLSGPARTLCLTGSSLGNLLPAKALGFEVSSRSIDLQLKADPLPSLFAAQASRLPLADGSIDGMIRLDDQIAMTDSLRVLKPGGRLIRILPSPGHLLEARRHLFSGRRQGLREKPELVRAIHDLSDGLNPPEHLRFTATLAPDDTQWSAILGQWGHIEPAQLGQLQAQVPAVTFAWDIYVIRKPGPSTSATE